MNDLLKAADAMAEALREFRAHYPHGINPYLDATYRTAREALAAYEAAKREAEVHPSMVDRLSIMNDDIAPAGKANVGNSRPIP